MVNSIFAATGTSIFESISRLAGEREAINLGQGFPTGLEPEAVIEAAVRALRSGPHQYPPMLGLPALRQAVAANSLRFHGLELDWEREVLVTSGATEAMADAFLALIEPGDEAIVLEPAYDAYAPLIRRAGGVVVSVRLAPPGWELPFEALAAAVTPQTRMIVVNNPMNPIGKVFTAEEQDFIARLVEKHGLYLVADEVYEHLVLDGEFRSFLAIPAIRDRVARIGSAGKTFSVTGWKVGYVTASEALLRPISRAHQFVTFTTPPALQAAVAEGLMLDDGYYDGLRAALVARRDALVGGLRATGFDVADAVATYFAIADISSLDPGGDDLAFARRLIEEAGVATVPISCFYGAREVRSHIRFCFAKDFQTLEAAVERLSRWRAETGRRAAS